jgi:hypothetical protein
MQDVALQKLAPNVARDSGRAHDFFHELDKIDEIDEIHISWNSNIFLFVKKNPFFFFFEQHALEKKKVV